MKNDLDLLRRTFFAQGRSLFSRHSRLPPSFLLPCRARWFNSTTPIIEDATAPPPEDNVSTSTISSSPPPSSPSSLSSPAKSTSIHPSIRTMLPLLRAQRAHYITAHIHARPYLVTEGDTVRLPFRMPDVVPGDVLRLTQASVIGSRDYTLKGAPYLDQRLFECRARVVSVESEPLRVEEKTRRRRRRIKYVRSKMRFTVLRIAEVKVKPLEDEA